MFWQCLGHAGLWMDCHFCRLHAVLRLAVSKGSILSRESVPNVLLALCDTGCGNRLVVGHRFTSRRVFLQAARQSDFCPHLSRHSPTSFRERAPTLANEPQSGSGRSSDFSWVSLGDVGGRRGLNPPHNPMIRTVANAERGISATPPGTSGRGSRRSSPSPSGPCP